MKKHIFYTVGCIDGSVLGVASKDQHTNVQTCKIMVELLSINIIQFCSTELDKGYYIVT